MKIEQLPTKNDFKCLIARTRMLVKNVSDIQSKFIRLEYSTRRGPDDIPS